MLDSKSSSEGSEVGRAEELLTGVAQPNNSVVVQSTTAITVVGEPVQDINMLLGDNLGKKGHVEQVEDSKHKGKGRRNGCTLF